MRDRETGLSQTRQELDRLREETARAASERDEAVRKAEAHMAGARDAVAAEVAELKRHLDETNQRSLKSPLSATPSGPSAKR